MKYRKKPVVIDAILWEGGDYKCLEEFCGMNWGRADAQNMPNFEEKENVVVWNTQERQYLHLPVGYWLIRGIRGELYPCKPDIFEKTYDAVSPTDPVTAPKTVLGGAPPHCDSPCTDYIYMGCGSCGPGCHQPPWYYDENYKGERGMEEADKYKGMKFIEGKWIQKYG